MNISPFPPFNAGVGILHQQHLFKNDLQVKTLAKNGKQKAENIFVTRHIAKPMLAVRCSSRQMLSGFFA